MGTAGTIANAPTLAQRAHNVRRNALRMGEVQGQGYIAQALDIADVLAVAYFHAMHYRPEEPSWEGRDRFLLSNGHYAIALYAALLEAGILPEAELETYGFDESRLPMSGMAAYTPGMEMSGGSLGLGLGITVGRALGLKRKGSEARVYTLFSDGELDEGSVWEAIMSASHFKLDNLIAVVDVNNQQADGPSTQMRLSSPWSTSSRPSVGSFSGSTAMISKPLWRHSMLPRITQNLGPE
jgi:transketolase